MKKETKDLLWKLLPIVGAGLIVFSLVVAASEVYGAYSFCHSLKENYSFSFDLKHRCNGQEIEHISLTGYKNSDFWQFKANTTTFSYNLTNYTINQKN